ncbi:hypothetical protein CAPTEDRAFT_196520 [Capitella teleta]|uniref:Uncharacterized protein n=1 Tax=Capitella teleta TaxID=283909 RepID=R7VCM0_CAPTE|nr:hypothetical protein CAPTEDRAFT_196520 [Capitella teleta]|eukprot:ELU13430.1 hypothetical protein CAPTEDRAFT_196520 [Capitella teleta]
MSHILKVCESFAGQYNVIFNGAKSHTIVYQSRRDVKRSVAKPFNLNGNSIHIVQQATHLGTLVGVRTEAILDNNVSYSGYWHSIPSAMAGVLMHAVKCFHFKQMQYLLKSGLSINIKDNTGKNAMPYALEIEDAQLRLQMVRFLILRDIHLSDRDRLHRRNALMWACFLRRLPEARLIIRKGRNEIDLSDKDSDGKTVLHYAVGHRDVDLTREISISLLHRGYSVDVPDQDGFTPYLLARKLGHEDCADVLVSDGMASTCQFDQKAYKMARIWEEIGQQERSRKERASKEQKVANFKTLGRLSQLKRAGFKVDDVRFVPSRKDMDFLGLERETSKAPKSYYTALSMTSLPAIGNRKLPESNERSTKMRSESDLTLFPEITLCENKEVNHQKRRARSDHAQFKRSLSSLFELFGAQSSTVYPARDAGTPKPRRRILNISSCLFCCGN